MRIPTAPPRSAASRENPASDELIARMEISWIGNGREPYRRIVTRLFISAAVNPPPLPPVMIPEPPVMGLWMYGAETTVPSRTIAKKLPTLAVV